MASSWRLGYIMELVLLFLFISFSHSERHSMKYYIATSTGLQTFPEFMVVPMVDDIQLGFCDGENVKFTQDWVQTLNEDEPLHMKQNTEACRTAWLTRAEFLQRVQQVSDHPEGFHVIQEIVGCELNNETSNTSYTGEHKIGYEGADFMSLDVESGKWLYTENADAFQNKWSGNYSFQSNTSNLLVTCLQVLKLYLKYGSSSLEREVPPSVSFLRQSPSSPVSCHATGFYPHRADMFWRKDGEEIHEDVDQGEILPNQDGTFQMRVDLNISADEDWRRYECVFQLCGLDDDIITKLNKSGIRTNWAAAAAAAAAADKDKDMKSIIITAVVVVVVALVVFVIITVIGYMWRKRNTVSVYRLHEA